MFLITSPSKTQDFSETNIGLPELSKPEMRAEIQELVSVLKSKDKREIKDLMSLSDKLAELNFSRYQVFSKEFNNDNAKPALLAFKGDVYSGIEVDKYSKEDFLFAQKYLRIISGLYGILKPMDLMQPYRLEMGTNLKFDRYKNLYEFWGDKIMNSFNEFVTQEDIIMNLASNEYSQVIDPKKLKCRMVNVSFKENKDGNYKIIGLFAKRARGKMINYIIKNRILSLNKVKEFDVDGYKFNQELSDENNMVFVR